MLDVAIVGGGLCGLAVAQGLQARGLDWGLFEARQRLGGRILTHLPRHGPALDLGPAWFWPRTQPAMARLVQDLGLSTLPQGDDGWVTLLDDPGQGPRRSAVAVQADGALAMAEQPQPGALHGGAQRLTDGMAALVTALAAWLPRERLHAGQVLRGLRDEGDHVCLRFEVDGQRVEQRARRVALALPPRLLDEHVDFHPPLPATVQQALQDTPTWMAAAAKTALAAPPGPPAAWRAQGRLGNAWVSHPQAVLTEVFDIGVRGDGDALSGFLALGPAQRREFANGLPLLLRSQVEQLFGAGASEGEWRTQDWATEACTCSRRDAAEEGAAGPPGWTSEWLRQPQWAGRLLFGGSETARQAAGYLEGALHAAGRLKSQLASSLPVPTEARA
jgi:monoamine oxidase